jgi:hypothetical protein
VRKVFEWLVNEGLSTSAITYRLRALNVPTKFGKIWNRVSIQAMLKNPGYIGKTYVFSTMRGRKKFTKPRAEWVEIQGVTPAIVSSELFEAAQKQLQAEQGQSRYAMQSMNTFCADISGAVSAGVPITAVLLHQYRNGKRRVRRYYRCLGKVKMCAP